MHVEWKAKRHPGLRHVEIVFQTCGATGKATTPVVWSKVGNLEEEEEETSRRRTDL